MAKLIRCRSGHVFDSEAHVSCPECARTEAVEAEDGSAAQGGDGGGDGGGAKRGVPASWLAAGGTAALALIAAGFFLSRPTPPVSDDKPDVAHNAEPRSEIPSTGAASDPSGDPEFQACAKAVNDQGPCDRAIASGKFSGAGLAKLFLIRGFRRSAQQNVDGAFSDFGEAIKIEPNNAPALAGLGTIYVKKGDCSRGVETLDRSIRLDPNILVAYVARGGCLWDKGNRDGARADYQKALSLNPDPATRKSVEHVLDLIVSEARTTADAAPASSTQTDPPQMSGSNRGGAP